SLHVTFNTDGCFVVHSFAGDHWQNCDDHVRRLLGLPGWEPGDERNRRVPDRHLREFDRAAVDREAAEIRPRTEDDLARIKMATKLGVAARPPQGTVVEHYLAVRAIDLFSGVDCLRFHPRCPWRNENTGKTEYIPALIAAFTSIDDNDITGI